jgi:hypothetical protein
MRNTLILTVTHRGLSDETYESIIKTDCRSVLKIKGQACIDRARSIGFDKALQAFRALDDARNSDPHGPVADPDNDVLLCVDDDMVFSPHDAQNLVDHCRKTKHPVSALAVNSHGELTHKPWPSLVRSEAIQTDRYATGLAFMAVPRRPFERIAETLPKCGDIRVWCLTGPNPTFPGQWIGEDYAFCQLWAGVHLLPSVQVGHVKSTVLYPKTMRLDYE